MLWRVVIQKPVVGKSEPREQELVRNRRVVIVDSEGAYPWVGNQSQLQVKVIKYVLANANLMAGTTGEIVEATPYPREQRSVVICP